MVVSGVARPEEFICCHGSEEIVRKVKHSSVRIENPLSALYMGTEYFSLARTFRTVCGGGYGSWGKHHLSMTSRQGPSEWRSRPWLREWEGPAAVAVGRIAPTGRTAPTAPAGITCPKFL